MRLIDADALVKEIEKIALEAEQQVHGRRSGKTLAKGILFGLGAARKIILDQPTAYDLNKVVEQLEKESQTSASAKSEAIIGMCGASANHYDGEECAYKRAIEIVKGGGVDAF